ncbi:hypothetical protein [Bradyrhizobium sp. CER78]|uniref:hypothetical protein n=1 Tax=Bradyrhizobium sp. CER78 TaxID=3039162 RepID=UPI00244D64A9|nr:hypothetical protein [Bradyrhizobium sp. CER78]MDH2381766.1 hypothetical protein [Bradyrhizobium sp. CER78]
MESIRTRNPQSALMSLEADAVSARTGFACLFSDSDEYETALIAERRAQGRYEQPKRHWPIALLLGVMLMVAGTVLLFG